MLVDRDWKITSFKKEKYHHVRLTLGGAEAVSEKIAAPEEAETLRAACAGAEAVCASVTREQKKEAPPKLYDLTTLQREANRIFGYTAKQTLDYAQSLYEKKLLTYPRTDSRYLTADMAETASAVLHLAAKLPPFGGCGEFFPDVSLLVNDKKVSDHHAIIPTLELEKASLSELPWASAISSCWCAGNCCARRRSPMCTKQSRPLLTVVDRPSPPRSGASSPRAGVRSTAFSAPP